MLAWCICAQINHCNAFNFPVRSEAGNRLPLSAAQPQAAGSVDVHSASNMSVFKYIVALLGVTVLALVLYQPSGYHTMRLAQQLETLIPPPPDAISRTGGTQDDHAIDEPANDPFISGVNTRPHPVSPPKSVLARTDFGNLRYFPDFDLAWCQVSRSGGACWVATVSGLSGPLLAGRCDYIICISVHLHRGTHIAWHALLVA